MENREQYSDKLKRARKRVKEIKDFYEHLKAYIIVNLLLLYFKGGVLNFIFEHNEAIATGLLDWINYNFVLSPILWGTGLIIHGLIVYRHKFTFLKQWEENQIRKFIEEDKSNLDKYN